MRLSLAYRQKLLHILSLILKTQLAIASVVSVASAKPIDSLQEISKHEEFDRFANKDSGGIIRSGKVIKFLIDNRNFPEANVYYLNSNFCEESKKKPNDNNCNYVFLHRDFANHKFKLNLDTTTYFDMAYNTSNLKEKKFIDGRVQVFEIPDPNGTDIDARKQVYGVWFIERDLISEEGILFVLKKIRKTFMLNDKDMMFVRYNETQTTDKVGEALSELGIGVTSLDKILMGVPQLPLNKGVAYGFLRWHPKDPLALAPTDIPVFNVLPLDLGVVAASITTTFQDVASHVNLKAKERKTPNIAVLSPSLIQSLEAYKDKPVRLEVNDNGFLISTCTEQEIYDHQPKFASWQKARTDLSITQPILYSQMCKDIDGNACLKLAGAFGGKAMQLGFLSTKNLLGAEGKLSRDFGYPLSPLGFGLPISFFNDFLNHNKSLNPHLAINIDILIRSERGELERNLSQAEKLQLIADIQEQIRNGEFPKNLEEKVYLAVEEMRQEVKRVLGFDLLKVKVRSSANVEDIAGFDGAGLHDSFSAKVDLPSIEKSRTQSQACRLEAEVDGDQGTDGNDDGGMNTVKSEIKPKTIICAIKGVYASIFNHRAIAERSYRGFDHETAMMGIAIVPSYKSNASQIIANSVLITRVLNTSTVYGYQMATQKGNNLATNPIPGTISEMSVIAFQVDQEITPTITVQRYAKVDPAQGATHLTTRLLPDDIMFKIQRVGRTIEEEYCRAKKDYYAKCNYVSNSAKKERSLDMEVKIYSDKRILFKQFREFSGK
jgi:hypothetical protein